MKKLFACLLALVLALGCVAALAEEVSYEYDPTNPYVGVMKGTFHNNPVVGGGVSTYYLADGLEPWAPAVIVLTPNNTTAQAFSESEIGMAWRAVADEQKIGLTFLEPADGKEWNLTLDPNGRDDLQVVFELYIKMRSKARTEMAPFSMDKTHCSLVGYGEGGAMALLAGAYEPASYSSIVAVDAPAVDAQALATIGEHQIVPFPADGVKGVEEMNVLAKNVESPVWFINSDTSAMEYFVAAGKATAADANDFAETAFVGENPAIRVWASQKSFAPAEINDAFTSKTNRYMAMQDGGRVAFTTDFTAKGWSHDEVWISGEPRRWITYVPASYDGTKEVPLVLGIHGYTASMTATAEESRLADLADENGFIVIFPNGLVRDGHATNVPCTQWRTSGDDDTDVKFISQLLDIAEATYKIDASRIYITGHSNGSAMTWRLGVALTDRLAGIAPIGAMSAPSTPFASDALLPTWSMIGEYDGGGYVLTDGKGNVKALKGWAEHNGLDETKVEASEAFDGQWQTITFANEAGVPLVRYTGVNRTAHIYMPEQAVAVWEFFTHFTRGEDGTLYYDGEAVQAGEYVASDAWYNPAEYEGR